MKSITLFLAVAGLFVTLTTRGQNKLPYYEIPDPPRSYTATTVVARMIDGLGFRYYWATEGLRSEDLAFQPSKDARTSLETIKHIYGLSRIIVNSTMKTPTEFGLDEPALSFEDLRRKTLENFLAASQRLKSSRDKDLNEFKMIFKRDSLSTTFPFWNEINGPIADALWHVGQVITFRRSSGNPYNSNASVLTGKVATGKSSGE